MIYSRHTWCEEEPYEENYLSYLGLNTDTVVRLR